MGLNAKCHVFPALSGLEILLVALTQGVALGFRIAAFQAFVLFAVQW